MCSSPLELVEVRRRGDACKRREEEGGVAKQNPEGSVLLAFCSL